MKSLAKLLLPVIILALIFGRPEARAGVEIVPPTGKALICFYREVWFQGNICYYRLGDGGKVLGSLPSESFLFYTADAGEHTFHVGLVRESSITLNVEPGHVYYLRCVPPQEVFFARPHLQLMPVVEGAAVVSTLRPGLAAR